MAKRSDYLYAKLPQTGGGSGVKNDVKSSGEYQMGPGEAQEDSSMLSTVKRHFTNCELYVYSVFRGYQERQQQKEEVVSATKIQRRFRRHLSDHDINETAEGQGPHTTPKKSEKTKESITTFQDEITELKWKADQQMEISMGGVGFVPPRVLLVSSKVPKGDVLPTLAHPKGVIVIHYDFDNHTCDSLLKSIERHLDAYKEGSRARTLCLYCQGGPGHLYLVKRKVVTVAKLKKETEADQVRFWKELGALMSKITPEETKFEIMGCNLMGTEKGQELVEHLAELMKPSIVRIDAPLEQSEAGRKVIESYFDYAKYTLWKNRRNSKVDGMD